MNFPHPASLLGRHEFLIRRLHSLLGLMPIGGYLCFHLATNAAVWDGPATYQHRADQIHVVGPSTLFFLEWGLIFLPILFHGLVGLIIVSRGKRNVWHYPYPENIRYTLQRGTGVIAFAFIIWHVFQMHGWFHFPWWSEHVLKPFGGGLFVPAHAPATAAAVIQSSTLVLALYAVGVLACAYHLADGVWTAGITWGVWTSPRAQRAMTRVCAAFGLGLAVLGLGALYAMETVPLSLPPVSTEAIESRASGPRQTPQPAGVVRRRIAEAANPFRVKGTVPFSSTIAARWCPRKLGQSPAKGGGP